MKTATKASKTLAFLILTAATLAAQASGSSGPKKPAAAAKATSARQPLSIPKDAVANPDGSFTWTDKDGRKWNYAQTPFGVVRSEVAPAPAAAFPLAGVKAFDEGVKVRFEQASPFGTIKWEKKKTDLTDDERNLLNNQTLNSQTPGPNAKQD